MSTGCTRSGVALGLVLGIAVGVGCHGTPLAPDELPPVFDPCAAVTGGPPGGEGAATADGPSPPGLPGAELITFAFRGTIGGRLGCDTVPAGTPLRGTFTFDPTTSPTPSFEPKRVDYIGVVVEITVGDDVLRGNDPMQAKIQVADGPPFGDSYSLIVNGGFASGGVGGRWIKDFVWVVSGPSTMFPDTSLLLGPGFFGPRVGSRVCLGDCFRGERLEGGRVEALWRVN